MPRPTMCFQRPRRSATPGTRPASIFGETPVYFVILAYIEQNALDSRIDYSLGYCRGLGSIAGGELIPGNAY
jgi:hypothetical protein